MCSPQSLTGKVPHSLGPFADVPFGMFICVRAHACGWVGASNKAWCPDRLAKVKWQHTLIAECVGLFVVYLVAVPLI